MPQISVPLTANEERPVHQAGNYVYVETAAGAVKFSLPSGETINRKQGQWFKTPEGFNTFQVKDLSGGTNGLVLEVQTRGGIEYGDNRTSISGTITTVSSKPGTVSDSSETVGSASAELMASNANVLRRTIQPRGGDIYIRKAGTASDTNGILVEDGVIYETDFTGQINAIRAGGADVTTWTEEETA